MCLHFLWQCAARRRETIHVHHLPEGVRAQVPPERALPRAYRGATLCLPPLRQRLHREALPQRSPADRAQRGGRTAAMPQLLQGVRLQDEPQTAPEEADVRAEYEPREQQQQRHCGGGGGSWNYERGRSGQAVPVSFLRQVLQLETDAQTGNRKTFWLNIFPKVLCIVQI